MGVLAGFGWYSKFSCRKMVLNHVNGMVSDHALLPPAWYCCLPEGTFVAGFKFILGVEMSPIVRIAS